MLILTASPSCPLPVNVLNCMFTVQVLTPAQLAFLSAAAYPLLPDPTAMAEASLEDLGS